MDIPVNLKSRFSNKCFSDRLNRPPSKPHPTGPASPSTVEAVARNLEDTDDTMKNLRKTFAGIFGDM